MRTIPDKKRNIVTLIKITIIKYVFRFFVLITITSSLFCSCEKEDAINVSINKEVEDPVINCQLVSLNTILSISEEMESLVDTLQSYEMTRGTAAFESSSLAQMSEAQIEQALQPMVQNGREIQSALITTVNDPAYGLELTPEEYTALHNLDDVHLAQLSVQLSLVYGPTELEQINGLQITLPMFRDCLIEAVGWPTVAGFAAGFADKGLQGMLTGGILNSSLMTGKTALAVFRGLVSHALGWFSVIYTVVEFGTCIKEKQP